MFSSKVRLFFGVFRVVWFDGYDDCVFFGVTGDGINVLRAC